MLGRGLASLIILLLFTSEHPVHCEIASSLRPQLRSSSLFCIIHCQIPILRKITDCKIQHTLEIADCSEDSGDWHILQHNIDRGNVEPQKILLWIG